MESSSAAVTETVGVLTDPALVASAQPTSALVVTHTAEGEILSLHWPDIVECRALESLVGESVSSLFGPVAIEDYFQQVQQVLATQKPEEFQCVVRCGSQPVSFEFLLSPLPTDRTLEAPSQEASLIGVGRQIVLEIGQLSDARLSSSDGESRYFALLSRVASNIRRTLDLKTIWQQTVSGLGELLGLDRCLVCDYSQKMHTLTVVAEHHQVELHPCLGKTFDLALKSDFLKTLESLKPEISDFERGEDDRPYTVLTVATCYQSEPNGILVLQQPPDRPWEPLEIALIQELTDQVGTAIAHAKLFSESQNITQELRKKSKALRQTNDELRRKHDELEEARQQAEQARQQAEEARQQAEEARQQAEAASRLKSNFLANTSHELRTPLNGMIGFLRLVLDDMADDEEEKLEFIRESHNSAIHLLNLINDVLDIAKIEAGKMNLDMSAISLKELLAEIENSLRPHIERSGLKFDIELPETLDEIKLYGNYQRLKQVLLNLVGNANKFTHEGGITISTEIQPQTVDFDDQTWPGFVKISVADTGIGVSLEKQDRLFQTFSQVDSARTRQYEGTGLGLAISQRLVEAMGGKVKFVSMGEGLGSTVSFTAVLYQEPVMKIVANA